MDQEQPKEGSSKKLTNAERWKQKQEQDFRFQQSLNVGEPGQIARQRAKARKLAGVGKAKTSQKKPSLKDRQQAWAANENRKKDLDYVLAQVLKNSERAAVGHLCFVWHSELDPLRVGQWTIGRVAEASKVKVLLGGVAWQNFRVISKTQAQVFLRACAPSDFVDALLADIATW